MDDLRSVIAEMRTVASQGTLSFKLAGWADRLEAAQALQAAPEGGEWRSSDSAPEGAAVLLAIEYANGTRRVIRAMRAGERTLHLGDDQDHWDGCIYDETEDAYFCAPGWYEKNEYDECNWMVHDKPIAWQHLPDPSTA